MKSLEDMIVVAVNHACDDVNDNIAVDPGIFLREVGAYPKYWRYLNKGVQVSIEQVSARAEQQMWVKPRDATLEELCERFNELKEYLTQEGLI